MSHPKHTPLGQALQDLHQRYQQAYEQAGLAPTTEYLDEWQAPCYDGEVRYGMVPWRAVEQSTPLDFAGIAHGLERELHEDVCTFYQSFYAADLHLTVDGHDIVLSQVMCAEDGDRLQRNLVGHVLMKQRLQQDITLFIGTGEASEDLIVSVDNLTGVVGLEFVGKPMHEKLANSLQALLKQAQPRVVKA